MTDTSTPKELTALGKLISKVTANPATLEFPTDPWGFTSKLRKEVLQAASMVRGQDDKHDLLVGTLAILITHIKARKDRDEAERLRQLDEVRKAAAERAPREAYSAPRLVAVKP